MAKSSGDTYSRRTYAQKTENELILAVYLKRHPFFHRRFMTSQGDQFPCVIMI